MINDLDFRLAKPDDLQVILEMIADDPLGKHREKLSDVLPECYVKAFEEISKNKIQELTVVLLNGEIAGTFQITYLQYLTYQGGIRSLVEAVRVRSDLRGKGIGRKMFDYIIKRSKEKGCHMIQLTSDKSRVGSLKFYEQLGFKASHEGFKMKL